MTNTYAIRLSENGGKTFRQLGTGLSEANRDEQVGRIVVTQAGRGREPEVTRPTDEKLPGRDITEIHLRRPAEGEAFVWQFINEI